MHNFTIPFKSILLVFTILISFSAASQCPSTVNAYPYAESFETGSTAFPGTWVQGIGDDGDWTRNSLGTQSGGTGPNAASDGTFYMYTEASTSGLGSNATVYLESPCFDLTGQTGPQFNFDYHMFGNNMGTLRVDISTNNGTTWTNNWSISGNQGNMWFNQTIDLSAYIGQTIRLRFNGTTGNGWSSDMAVDNVSLITTTPQPEINVVGLGNTIPDGDITPAVADNTDFGDFNIPSAPIVHTFTIQNTGTSDLNLTGAPLVQITGADYTVTALPTTPISAGGSTTFSISFSPTTVGVKNATVTIANNDSNENPYNFSITGNAIIPPSCISTINTYPYSESFESGIGGWSQSADDDEDWTRLSGPTSSGDTGPSMASDGLFYYYTEASDNTNETFFFDSPCFDLTGLINPQFSFDFHRYGLRSGDFKLQISTNNGLTYNDSGWFQDEKQVQQNSTEDWINVIYDLSNYIGQTVKLRMHVTTLNSHQSDIAIDNIMLTDPILTNGPGGVTSSLQMWLNSTEGLSYTDGNAVSLWVDQGNGSDATANTAGQEPTYYDNPTENINFNPVISFDNIPGGGGLNPDPTVLPQEYLSGDSGFFSQDIFIVILPDVTVNRSLAPMDLFTGDANASAFSNTDENDVDQDITGIGLGAYSARHTNEVISYDIGANNLYGLAETSTTSSYDNVGIINVRTTPSENASELFYNGLNIGTTEVAPLTYRNIYNSRFWIGRSQSFIASYDGKVAEIITYSSRKSDADLTQEHNKIQSYLALKYGITLGVNGTSQDYVDSDGTVIWDQSANTGFNYNITGIGRDDASELDQRQSLSINNAVDGIGPIEGILTMGLTDIYDTNNLNKAATTGFGDKQFLTWGDNNGDLNLLNMINVDLSSGIAGLSTPVTFESNQRIWKVVETGGDVGEVKVRIPMSALRGISPPGDFYMFISDTSIFDPTATYRVMRPSLSDPTVLEGNYDFDGTKFITFGYAEEIARVRSVYFDGSSDFIDMEDNLDLNPAGFTISAWIKRDATTNNASILSKRNTGYTSGYDLRLDGARHVQMRWINGVNQSVTSSIPIPENEWHHVAVTYNGSNAKIYIDGVLDTNANLSAPLATNESFYIAAAGKNTPTAYFGGNIDEVRVWDTELNVDQLRYVMNQEIQDNAGMADGVVLPTAITRNDIAAIPWNQLAGYYPMTRYTYTNTKDESGNDIIGALRNLNTVDFQTAPLPYESAAAGSWSTASTWLNNTVQTIPNALSIIDNATPVNWNIVRTNHDISINTETILGYQRQVLGLFIDSNTISVNGSTASRTGNALTVSHYLRIDGKLDLNGESQLIQTLGSDFDVLSSGTLERDQQGTEDLFTYNYWASPVGISNTTSNNNSYTVPDIFFDGTNPASPQTISFLTSGFDGTNGSPIGLADYWIWKFSNLPSDDYSEWQHVRSTGTLLAGEGFTLKGVSNTSGAVSNEQNYVFDGKPNNGDITLSINSGNDYLVGNPYPSAIDAIQFINDNGTSTTGTLYFWEHWGGGSHVLSEYQGGYATYNLSGGAPASGNDPDVGTGGTPTKTPGQYIPVAQGFFVTSLNSGTIEFNNGQRFYEKEGAGSIFVRKGNPNAPTASSSRDNRTKIRVGFNSINGLHRQLLLTEDSRATPGIDWGFDGELTEDQIDDMYWMIDNQKFIIQGIDVVNKYVKLPLGVHTRDSGDNTFTIDDLINVPNELEIYLHDKETEVYQDLRAGDYTINLLAGEYLTRFEIVFMNGAIVLDNDNIEALDTNIELYYANANNAIVINNPSLEVLESVELFNILGQSIVKFDDVETIEHSEIKLKAISSGNYIVKLKTEKGEISKKVLID